MPFSMTESTMFSLQAVPVTTLPSALRSCDSAWLWPDCSSSEIRLSASILKATTSLVVSQRPGMMEQTTVPLSLIVSSPTPTPLPPGSGSGTDQSLLPSPTPVSLPAIFILITFPQLGRQDYEAIKQDILEQVLANFTGYVLAVDEEQSDANMTVLQLYLVTAAGMPDEQATINAFHVLLQLITVSTLLPILASLYLCIEKFLCISLFRNLTFV